VRFTSVVFLSTPGINRWPSTSLASLAKYETVEQFLAVYDWVVEENQSS
jgi:hypothetical protein